MSERNLDFDTIIERRGTDCIKYDMASQYGYPEDILPLWVADMDFKTSSYVEDAVIERTKNGVFGYSEASEAYFEALHGWLERHHNWNIRKEWCVRTPGVVFALATAVKAYTNPGDRVLIQQPVYYPFSNMITRNGREVVSNDLILEGTSYRIDFDDFENKIVENDIKLFILCNPHNPVSKVHSREELEKLGDICLKHGVTVVSDEIHSDFDYNGKHTVFATVKEEFENICIVCTAASKTFNLATMTVSNIIIPDAGLRTKFEEAKAATGASQLPVLGLVATQAAYEHGEEWYNAMISYVKGNIEYVKEYVKSNMKGVRVIEMEGTYLMWLDFRGTGIPWEELDRRIVNDAKVWLDSGSLFGKTGEGFQRINVAAPRKIIEECMKRLKSVI